MSAPSKSYGAAASHARPIDALVHECKQLISTLSRANLDDDSISVEALVEFNSAMDAMKYALFLRPVPDDKEQTVEYNGVDYDANQIHAAKKEATELVAHDADMFVSRRMQKQVRQLTALNTFSLSDARRGETSFIGWTIDPVDVHLANPTAKADFVHATFEAESQFEVRPSRHVPGILGVFATRVVKPGTAVCYPGVIMTEFTWHEFQRRVHCPTVASIHLANKKNVKASTSNGYIFGNPCSIAAQVNHTFDVSQKNCIIEVNDAVMQYALNTPDVVRDRLPANYVHVAVLRELPADTELLTTYDNQHMADEKPGEFGYFHYATTDRPWCDFCQKRVQPTEKKKHVKCEVKGCHKVMHRLCMTGGDDDKEASKERVKKWKCDEHVDRSFETLFWDCLQHQARAHVARHARAH